MKIARRVTLVKEYFGVTPTASRACGAEAYKVVQAPVGQSAATQRHFCKSADAVECAGAAYTRAASLSRMPDWEPVQAFVGEYKNSR